MTATWTQPQDVLLSVRGEFHWYLNPYPADVCTEVWVHSCVPSAGNHYGFDCP